MVRSNNPKWGFICKDDFISARDNTASGGRIRRALPIYSFLAPYFLFMISGGVLTRGRALEKESLEVILAGNFPNPSTFHSFDDIGEFVQEAFSLTQADWSIIEDFLRPPQPWLRTDPSP
uniref:Uncharacterized protein n=1 Tax=Candidatus Kentrum sp. TC TaxID=2126339 RepID=A0A450YJJ0_9GAMM|nr:MAG: hypothetical protein BECKTC1821E_GA0114239_101316 [Candidatus Kentron sp. TC]VFK53812.1 MAG: hypothetical protein BECKTC1821F_GA0114240_100388 [Candidatus Kentron sp. TC]